MTQNINEIEINGLKYVPKSSVSQIDTSNTVIVRCKSAGVFMGVIKEKQLGMGLITLNNARRLWYWSGAASLSQLAVDGTSKPKECKFPVAVPEVTLTEVLEVISCTETAVKSLTGVAVWSA
jgi:hypothetical protein